VTKKPDQNRCKRGRDEGRKKGEKRQIHEVLA
jgi:hypothetical protein